METTAWFYAKFLALLAVVSLMVGFNFARWGFHRSARPLPRVIADGRPERGKAQLHRYGCTACHTLPGETAARKMVGPSLEQFGDQMYIAGALTNTPENLMRWIQDPQRIRPGTVMPDLDVTAEDARDIAAYLYAPKSTAVKTNANH